jgi:hypothetical protein
MHQPNSNSDYSTYQWDSVHTIGDYCTVLENSFKKEKKTVLLLNDTGTRTKS